MPSKKRSPYHDCGLRPLLPLLLFFLSVSAESFRSDSKEPIKPPGPEILEEIPIKPGKTALPRQRLFFNECEECLKDNRQWRYDVNEVKSIIERCGADYMLIRYDRKFVNKECEIITRFNFSFKKESVDLDSIEMLWKYGNGDMQTLTITTVESGTMSALAPASATAALKRPTLKASPVDMETLTKRSADFESKIMKTNGGPYLLYFRMGEKAWTATGKAVSSVHWPWKKSPPQNPLAGYMAGYIGENPSIEGTCFSERQGNIIVKNLFVDYPLNQCRISLEIQSGSPLQKALFSTVQTIDSITLGGEKNVTLSKILSVDTGAHHIFMEIADVYGTTMIKKISVYDQLRKYHAQRDTSRRLHRIKDSLSSRSTAFKTAYFMSKFEGNPISPLMRDYCDRAARKAMKESGAARFAPSSRDSLTRR